MSDTRIHVEVDHGYPVFFLTDARHGQPIDLTLNEIRRFARASDEWEAVQEMVRERIGYGGGGPKPPPVQPRNVQEKRRSPWL